MPLALPGERVRAHLEGSRRGGAALAATEALLSGSIDAAFIGPGPTTNAYVQSKAITVVAGAAANGAALVVKPAIT